MRCRVCLIVLTLVASALLTGSAMAAASVPGAAPERFSVAVMYFTNRGEGDEWDWLRKGLADLLITDLATSDRLLLVERERLQEVLKELKVAQAGVIDQETAVKAGALIQADYALFGSYGVEAGILEVEAHLIDLARGTLRRVEWVKGPVRDVHRLEKELAEKLIANLDVKLSDAERARLRRLQTDSVDAMTHFYRGLDLYDRGDYAHAFAGFRTAVSKDAAYVRAAWWVAKIYIAMNEIEHGLLAYREVLERFADDVLVPEIHFDYGLALEQKMKDYVASEQEYTFTIDAQPMSRRSYDELLRERQAVTDAAWAKQIDHKQWEQWSVEREISSRLFRRALYRRAHCRHRLGLLDRAVEDLYGVYASAGNSPSFIRGQPEFGPYDLLRELHKWYAELVLQDAPPTYRPSWSKVFKDENDSFVITPSTADPRQDYHAWELWNGSLLEAPPGLVFDTVTAEMEFEPIDGVGYPWLLLTARYGSMEMERTRYMVRNLDPHELTYTWTRDIEPNAKLLIIGEIQWQEIREKIKRVRFTATFKPQEAHDNDQAAAKQTEIALQLRPEWAVSWINGHPTPNHYAKIPVGPTAVKVSAPGYPDKQFEVEVPPEGLTLFVSLENDWTAPMPIARWLGTPALVLDRHGFYHVVAVREVDGITSLYEIVSRDAENWTEPVRLPVNSDHGDTDPKLIEAEDGRLVLAWESTREKESGLIMCVSTSKDGREWTDPVILRREGERRKSSSMFALYALWQDTAGIFWLQTTDGPYRSTDARSWTLVTSTERTKWRQSPGLQVSKDGLVFRCSGDERSHKGSEAVKALGLRPGQSRSWGFRNPREVVLLPDGSVFYCGTIEYEHSGSYAAVEDVGLAAFSRDGETWTVPYRHHCMNHASIVWDRGSRLVSVQEYGTSIDHEGSGLAVSFCDIDRLGGRGEAHPTPLQVLSPAEHTGSESEKSYFRNLRILQMTAQAGRFFCWGMKGRDPVDIWEIDPATGASRARVASAITPPTVSGTSWSDTDGKVLWIATQEGGGLIAYSLETGESKTYTTKDGLVSNNVQTVRCHEGKVYIGTLSGLNILDPATGHLELITKKDGMPDNSIRSIAFRGTQMWVGTKGNGVMMLDEASGEWTHFPPQSGPSVTTSAIFFEGDMVFCAGHGVHAYNIRTGKWTCYIDWDESASPVRDGDLLWFPVWPGIYTLNLKTLEVRKHFIRSPSYLAWQTNPNTPNCLTILGDKVLFATWGPEMFAVSKEELLRNSFSFDEYEAMHRPASNDDDQGDRP